MTELSQEAKDILAEIRDTNEAIKPGNSGLVKEPKEDDCNLWLTLQERA